MATATITLPITKSGYVRELDPTIVFPTDSDEDYKISRDYVGSVGYKNGLCFGFEALPDRLKYARIYSIAITLNLKNSAANITAGTDPIEDFDPETLTYANRKQTITSNAPYFGGITQVFSDVTSRFQSQMAVTDISRISVSYLRSLAFIVQDAATDKTRQVHGKILLTDDSDPYITVTYDDQLTVSDSVTITQPIGGEYPGSFNAAAPNTVEWDLIRDSSDQYYCYAESFEQASAVFYWRKQGESAWNQITKSGAEKRLVIPANTFTTDPETPYEYYIQVTDVLGNTVESGISTCLALQNIIKVLTPPSPNYGYYYNPHRPISFGWEVYNASGEGTTIEGMTVDGQPGDITIVWSVGSGEEHQIQVPFGLSQYDVPAETFPAASSIRYTIQGTDSTGYICLYNTVKSTFRTAAGPITTVGISPINSVQKNNQEINFAWQYVSDDGNPPSRFELLWRTYGSVEWNTLASSSDIVTEYIAAADTFPVGQIEWTVIAYNLDDIEGNYSIYSFIAYGAPDMPLVSATDAPFTTISWQSDGQQAFEVEINGMTYGPYFGEDKTFEPPDKLADGEYLIRVRVAGTYFLWSDWGETSITVENVSDFGVYLSGSPSVDAHLEWETDAETGDFYVYRDGILIARTFDYEFDDRLANGEHVYQVLNRLPDGNYCISLEVTAGTLGRGTYITAADASEPWIFLQYSTESTHDIQRTDSAVTVFANYSGDIYPHGFTSIYRDAQLTLSAAFKDIQEEILKRFEALLGRPVIVKRNQDPVFVGIINTWTKLDPQWKWKSYSCSIQRIEWEDFVDGTTGNNTV